MHSAHLAEAIPKISELDLNPVFALPAGQGCRIVDARIRAIPPQAAVQEIILAYQSGSL